MATVANVFDEVRRRLRDNTSYGDNTTLFNIVTQAERALNMALNSQYGVCQMSTAASRVIYDLQAEVFPAATFGGEELIEKPMRIDKIYDSVANNNREIHRVTLRELQSHDPNYWRATGSAFLYWTPIGRRTLILYPAKAGGGSAVFVQGPNQVTTYSNTASTIGLRDEHVPYLIDLTEAILYFRNRQLKEAAAIVSRLMDAIKTGAVQPKHLQ